MLDARPPGHERLVLGRGHGAEHARRSSDHFGLSGAVVGAVDLVRGIGRLAGLDVIDVPGATGGLDTDYGAKARAAIAALADHDLVWVHVEAPDEAGHMGDLREKVRAIERVDAEVLAPILAAPARPAVLVVPDHLTPLRTRTHAGRPGAVRHQRVAAGRRRRRRDGLRRVAGGRRPASSSTNGTALMRLFLEATG